MKGCKALQILILFYFIYFCTTCRLFIEKFVRKELNKQFLAIKYYNLGGACSTGCSNSHKSSNFELWDKERGSFLYKQSIYCSKAYFLFIYWRKLKGKVCRAVFIYVPVKNKKLQPFGLWDKERGSFLYKQSIYCSKAYFLFIYWRKLKGKVCRAVFDICTSEKQEASAFWTWYNTFLISFSGLRINYTPLLCKNIYRVNVNFTGFDKTEVDNNYRKKFGYKFGYSLSLQFSLKELILLYILKI